MSASPSDSREPSAAHAALTPAQIEGLGRQLEARRQQLAAELREGLDRHRRDSLPALGESVGDDGDRAFAEMLRGTDDAELQRDARELAEIETALGRIASGEYGICATCREPIGAKRLLAQPAALRCLRCQELHEHTYAPPDSAAP